MKKWRIVYASAEANLDSYTEGINDKDPRNYWIDVPKECICRDWDDLTEALKYVCNELCCTYNPDAVQIYDEAEYYGDKVEQPQTLVEMDYLVDKNGVEASESEKDRWREGKFELWDLYVRVKVEQIEVFTPTGETVREALGLPESAKA